MTDHSENIPEHDLCLKVYKVNTAPLFFAFAMLSGAIAMVTVDAVRLGLRDGGFGGADRNHLIASYLEIGATVLLLLWAVVILREKVFLPWRFLAWNRKRVPFIAASRDALTLLDRIVLPWSSIHDVGWQVCFSVRPGSRRKTATCILLKVEKEALAESQWDIRRAGFHRVPGYAIDAAREMEAVRTAVQLLCIEIDEQDGLTIDTEKFAEAAKGYTDYLRINAEDAAADGEVFEPDRRIFQRLVEEQGGVDIGAEMRGLISNARYFYRTVAMLLAATAFALSAVAYDLRSLGWPAVDAVVTVSRAGKFCAGSGKSWPELNYAYTVDGERFKGGKLEVSDLKLGYWFVYPRFPSFEVPDSRNACRSIPETQAILQDYPVGAGVQAYVDPKNPKVAVLRRPGLTMGTYAVCAAIALAYGLLAAFAIANMSLWFDD